MGGDREVEVDYRLLSATNRILMQEIENGRFRQDLYYRLNVISIEIPPLRQRPEDILPLARHFLLQGQTEARRLSQAAARTLTAYPWPGNVRELINALEHARFLSQSDVILPEHLPPAVRSAAAHGNTAHSDSGADMPAEVKTLGETEMETIRHALEQTAGNRTRAAKLLGITRRGLIYKLKRLGIK